MISRRLLVLLLILGTLICLCLICTGLARRPDDRTGLKLDLNAPSAERVRDFLTVKISSREIQLQSGAEAGCSVQSQRLIVPEDADCRFTIAAASDKTRRLLLQLGGAGQEVSVSLEQENAITVEETLAADDDPLALDVFRNPEELDALLTIVSCELMETDATPAPDDPPEACWLDIRR